MTDFLKLINENMGIAHKVCNIYFRDAGDREDVVQEMMYQLWRSFDSFDGRSKFSTWMYRVCLNTALMYRRKNDKHKSEPLKSTHEQIEVTYSSKEEDAEILSKAIGTLSEVNKAIILLYLEEMPYDDIASITGLTKSNVSVRIVRIKKELKELKDRL